MPVLLEAPRQPVEQQRGLLRRKRLAERYRLSRITAQGGLFGVLIGLVHQGVPLTLIATHNLKRAGRMDRTVRLEQGGIVAA